MIHLTVHRLREEIDTYAERTAVQDSDCGEEEEEESKRLSLLEIARCVFTNRTTGEVYEEKIMDRVRAANNALALQQKELHDLRRELTCAGRFLRAPFAASLFTCLAHGT